MWSQFSFCDGFRKIVLFGNIIIQSMESVVMSLKNTECSSRRRYAPLHCTRTCFLFLFLSISHQWWHPCLCSPGRLFSQSRSSLSGCRGRRRRARWMNERGGSSRSHYSLCCTVCWPLSAWPWRCSTPAGHGEIPQHGVRKLELIGQEMSNGFYWFSKLHFWHLGITTVLAPQLYFSFCLKMIKKKKCTFN